MGTFRTSCPELWHGLAARAVGRFSMQLFRRRKQEGKWVWLEADVYWHKPFWDHLEGTAMSWALGFPFHILSKEVVAFLLFVSFLSIPHLLSMHQPCCTYLSFLETPFASRLFPALPSTWTPIFSPFSPSLLAPAPLLSLHSKVASSGNAHRCPGQVSSIFNALYTQHTSNSILYLSSALACKLHLGRNYAFAYLPEWLASNPVCSPVCSII